MVPRRVGLIVNISFFDAKRYIIGNVPYGAGKAAVDRMSKDMAHELKAHGVGVVSLYPGFVEETRTPSVDFESPTFIGRAVDALAMDSDVLKKTGKALLAAELTREYGFSDTDGTQPHMLTTAGVRRRFGR